MFAFAGAVACMNALRGFGLPVVLSNALGDEETEEIDVCGMVEAEAATVDVHEGGVVDSPDSAPCERSKLSVSTLNRITLNFHWLRSDLNLSQNSWASFMIGTALTTLQSKTLSFILSLFERALAESTTRIQGVSPVVQKIREIVEHRLENRSRRT